MGGGRGVSGGEDGERAARRQAAAGDEETGKGGRSTHGQGDGVLALCI